MSTWWTESYNDAVVIYTAAFNVINADTDELPWILLIRNIEEVLLLELLKIY